MNTVPIIRLELESMQYAIQVALQQHAFAVDEQVKIALDKFLAKNNVQAIIDIEVEKAINKIVQEETRYFFQYGEGNKSLRVAVRDMLNKEKA